MLPKDPTKIDDYKKRLSDISIGKPKSKESIEKIRISKTGKPNLKVRGNNHGQYKGNDASYSSKHEYIRRYKPQPECCPICGEYKPLEIHNISGEYLIDNLEDWEYICRRCHMNKDGRNNMWLYMGLIEEPDT